ncbi:hypothetical protein [Kitasatospora sp. NPDC088346]|uniref:hypothetical protein n=1 Tax=Kitasatospora sp. NPDC088346 TaxID=3364073 RepID=UPI00382848CE
MLHRRDILAAAAVGLPLVYDNHAGAANLRADARGGRVDEEEVATVRLLTATYLLAFQLACESGSADHEGWTMRALTHQAIERGHTKNCTALAEAALTQAHGEATAAPKRS